MGIPVTSGMKFQVNYRMTYQGKNFQLTFWYSATTVTGTIDSDVASGQLNAALNTGLFLALANFISSSITVIQTSIQVVAPTRVRQNYYTPSLIVGSGPVTTTGNVSAAITKYGALSGRKFISHTHVPAPDDSTTMANGAFTVGGRALIDAIAAQIITPITGTANTFVPVINNGPTYSAVTFIEGASSIQWVRVMRRRTVGLKVTRRKKKVAAAAAKIPL